MVCLAQGSSPRPVPARVSPGVPNRYERSARLFTAFLTLAAALTCYKKLAT